MPPSSSTLLLLLIGIGPKIALVPFLETTKEMPEATKRRVLRKMLTTAATVAVPWVPKTCATWPDAPLTASCSAARLAHARPVLACQGVG